MTAMSASSVRQEQAALSDGGRVIVGVDDSPGGLTALRRAVWLARSANAPLVAVRVWALGLPRHGGLRRNGHGRGHVVLTFRGTVPQQEAARLVKQAFGTAVGGIPGDVDVTIETPEGNPGPVLTQFASTSGDVLVVGTTSGHGVKRVVHGSVSAYCAAHLPGQVSVIAAGLPGQDPAGPAPEYQAEPARAGDQCSGVNRSGSPVTGTSSVRPAAAPHSS
jgi:nucleotide-binding universal stress UspA family protein